MRRKLWVLDDYKLTSTYTVKDGPKPEWVAQMNLYALLLRENGYQVDRLRIITIFRDWQRAKALHTPDYPQAACAVLTVPMWEPSRTEQFIVERLTAHGRAQHELPECTAEERWEKPAVYALMKQGNKRATALYTDKEEAEQALRNAQATATKGAVFSLDVRPAESTRCLFYCPAAPFCGQRQSINVVTRIRQ